MVGDHDLCDGPLMALLEVLGVLIGSSPCQQHMSVPSDSFPQQLGHIAPHHIDILSYNPQ